MVRHPHNENSNGISNFFCWLNKIKTLLTIFILIGSGFTYVVLGYATTNNRLSNVEEELGYAKTANVNISTDVVKAHTEIEENTRTIIGLQRDVEHIRVTQELMYKESKEMLKQILERMK